VTDYIGSELTAQEGIDFLKNGLGIYFGMMA
jgi:hypothetical protein